MDPLVLVLNLPRLVYVFAFILTLHNPLRACLSQQDQYVTCHVKYLGASWRSTVACKQRQKMGLDRSLTSPCSLEQ